MVTPRYLKELTCSTFFLLCEINNFKHPIHSKCVCFNFSGQILGHLFQFFSQFFGLGFWVCHSTLRVIFFQQSTFSPFFESTSDFSVCESFSQFFWPAFQLFGLDYFNFHPFQLFFLLLTCKHFHEEIFTWKF